MTGPFAALLLKMSPVGRFLKAIFRWFTDNPWRLTLIIIAVLAWRLWAVDASRDDWRAKYEAAIEASKKAEATQVAMNAKRTQDEKDTANEADRKDAAAQLEGGRTAIVYRDRWRVRNVCAASQADPAASGATAPDSDGAGDVADMVAVSERDFNVCTANSIRLQSVNGWGEALIEQGLAVEAAPER